MLSKRTILNTWIFRFVTLAFKVQYLQNKSSPLEILQNCLTLPGNSKDKNQNQKQPSRGVNRKRYSETAKLQENTHENTLYFTWCSPVNLMYIFRIPFPENNCRGAASAKAMTMKFHVIFLDHPWKFQFSETNQKNLLEVCSKGFEKLLFGLVLIHLIEK